MARNNAIGETALNDTTGERERAEYSAAAAGWDIFARIEIRWARESIAFRKRSRRETDSRNRGGKTNGEERRKTRGLDRPRVFADVSGCRETVRGFLRVPGRKTCASFPTRRGNGIRQSPIRRGFYSNSLSPPKHQLRPVLSPSALRGAAGFRGEKSCAKIRKIA